MLQIWNQEEPKQKPTQPGWEQQNTYTHALRINQWLLVVEKNKKIWNITINGKYVDFLQGCEPTTEGAAKHEAIKELIDVMEQELAIAKNIEKQSRS
jgi:hypothetical protein